MASASLGAYFGYMLGKIHPCVDVIYSDEIMRSNVLFRFNNKSLIFLIAFPRYPRVTVELGRLAVQKGAKIVVITNSFISPLVPFADLIFVIPIGISSFCDAFAAPITFINALVTEFSERNRDITERGLKQFDEYASKQNIFLKSGVQNELLDKKLKPKNNIKVRKIALRNKIKT
jgi:DNA-binding MurR/RpiR family transcriptional regulator